MDPLSLRTDEKRASIPQILAILTAILAPFLFVFNANTIALSHSPAFAELEVELPWVTSILLQVPSYLGWLYLAAMGNAAVLYMMLRAEQLRWFKIVGTVGLVISVLGLAGVVFGVIMPLHRVVEALGR